MVDHSDRLDNERIFIRRFALSDAPFIISLLNEKTFIENIRDPGVRSIEDAERYLIKGPLQSYEKYGHGLSLVSLRDGTPIGMCGLLKRDTLPDVDLGFAFLSRYTGKGYATEASEAVLREGSQKYGLKKILAITTLTNNQSINVLTKLGFQFEKNIQFSPTEKELKLFQLTLNQIS